MITLVDVLLVRSDQGKMENYDEGINLLGMKSDSWFYHNGDTMHLRLVSMCLLHEISWDIHLFTWASVR